MSKGPKNSTEKVLARRYRVVCVGIPNRSPSLPSLSWFYLRVWQLRSCQLLDNQDSVGEPGSIPPSLDPKLWHISAKKGGAFKPQSHGWWAPRPCRGSPRIFFGRLLVVELLHQKWKWKKWKWPVPGNIVYKSGQIITTSAEVTLNGGLIRELPQNPLNSGLGIILICPDKCYTPKMSTKT